MTRRPLAILAAVLLAGLLVADLNTLCYVIAALVIGGNVVRFVQIGREDVPREVEEIERTTARTRRLTLDGSRAAPVIDLTAHRERLGVAAGETRPNKRRPGSGP